MLLVEHDMDFVMGLVDRLVVLDFGIKLAEGAPADIQRNPAVLEAYLGRSVVAQRCSRRPRPHVFYGKVEAVHGVILTRRERRRS